MNYYYYKQVIILIKKHLTVNLRWDCNEGSNRWVSIFASKSIHQQSVDGPGRKCVFVRRSQRCVEPTLIYIYTYI